MYGYNPLTSLDLLFLYIDERVSFDKNRKINIMKDLHTKI